MATKTVSCTACPWSDERDAATRAPSTCPRCGAGIAVDGEPAGAPAAKEPAPARRRK